MKKYCAEFFGTAILVFFGCGTAVVLGGFTGGTGSGFLGVLAISLAFGFAIVAGAYGIAQISGCHVNPAVSLSMLILGKMDVKDFVGYVVAQIFGAFLGSALLLFISLQTGALADVASLGQNGFGEASGVGLSMVGAIVVEIVLTFVFIFVIIVVTSKESTAPIAGIVIGFALTFVHLIGIPLTGTSVNPARSLAPAVLMGGVALEQVWVFIVAPFVGAILAALIYKVLYSGEQTE